MKSTQRGDARYVRMHACMHVFAYVQAHGRLLGLPGPHREALFFESFILPWPYPLNARAKSKLPSLPSPHRHPRSPSLAVSHTPVVGKGDSSPLCSRWPENRVWLKHVETATCTFLTSQDFIIVRSQLPSIPVVTGSMGPKLHCYSVEDPQT